jgi:hypothetical protein
VLLQPQQVHITVSSIEDIVWDDQDCGGSFNDVETSEHCILDAKSFWRLQCRILTILLSAPSLHERITDIERGWKPKTILLVNLGMMEVDKRVSMMRIEKH